MFRLTLLAPEIVEAILDGRQRDGVSLPAMMKPFSVEWAEQVPQFSEWDVIDLLNLHLQQRR